MEAINYDKSWEEIKDLLRIKLCNANIITFTSHFMDIQQWEKGILAAYIDIMIIRPSTISVMSNREDCCVKNQDISHDIALTLGTMNVMSMDILSWTVHTEYLLQELQQHITNHTKITMPDQVWGTTVKI